MVKYSQNEGIFCEKIPTAQRRSKKFSTIFIEILRKYYFRILAEILQIFLRFSSNFKKFILKFFCIKNKKFSYRFNPIRRTLIPPSISYYYSDLRPWSSWTANSDKKLNVYKPCVTSRKTANFSVNVQNITSFGKILKKLNANFVKILRKENIL